MIELEMKKELDLMERIGYPAMLEQAAEEAAEFAQACLKEARQYRNENPTHKEPAEIRANLHEEATDVLLCITQLIMCGVLDPLRLESWERQKLDRMKRRFEEEDREKN